MAGGNLGNLWYELDIKDISQARLQNIIKGIEAQLASAGKKGVTIGGVKIDPKAGQELVTKLRNIIKSSGGLKIDKVDVGKALRLQIDIKNIQEQLERHTFRGKLALDVNPAELQSAVSRALRAIPPVGASQLINLGGTSASVNSTADAVRNLNKQMNETSAIGKKVQSVLTQAFSVYAVKSFLSEVINIGGELEKQRLAMGNILGDMYEANELTKKISDLSMISPFTVQELTKATRLLTAYGVQYNEVYDITKRLSDIAAGVGVGFERIAYAFGHITSMGNLDARTLRMFQNMGVPLLQKLSDYYQETQGKSFSTAQVRKMITDKQVSSTDVINVLKQMTDAGGQFYQMQEVMAESLATKWANLANAWNLMLGSMAEDPAIGGNLKSLAEVLTAMTQNWKNVKAAMIPVIGYLLTVKANSLMAASAITQEMVANQKSILAMKAKRAEYLQTKVAGWELVAANRELVATVDHLTVADYKYALKTGMITKEMLMQVIASKQLSLQDSILIGKMAGMSAMSSRLVYNFGALGMAAKSFATTMKGIAMNPMTWIFAGAEVFMQMRQNSENEAEKIKENIDSLKQKSTEGAKNIKEALKNTEIPDKSRATMEDYKQKVSDIKEELKEYDPLYQKTFRDVDAVDGQGKAVHSLQEQYEMLRERLIGVKDAYEDVYGMASVPTDLNKATGDGWFDKTYSETAESYQKALDGVNSYVNTLMSDKDKLESVYKNVFANIEVSMSKAGGESLKKWQAMKIELDGIENTAEKLRRILTSTGEGGFNANATGLMGSDFQVIEKLFSASQGLKVNTQELGERLRSYLESLGLKYGTEGWETKAKMIMDGIMNLTSLPENAKLAIEKGFFTTTGIINWVDEGDMPAADPYAGGNSFQNRQYDAIDVLVKKGEGLLSDAEKESRKNAASTIKDIIKNGEDSVDTIEKMQTHIGTLRTSIKQLEKADDEESVKQRRRLEYELEYAEAAAKAGKYGTDKPKTTTGGGADKVKQGLQEEINLAKEAYAEYKKWYDLLNDETAAAAKVGENPLFQDADGKAIFGDPKDILGNYESILEKIGNRYPDLQRKLQSAIFDFKYDELKDNAAKAVSEMKEQIDRETKNWNLYQKLFDATGDKQWAQNAAFDTNNLVWSNSANALYDLFSKNVGEAISKGVLISTKDKNIENLLTDKTSVLALSDEDARTKFGALYDQWKELKQKVESEGMQVKIDIAEARKSLMESGDILRAEEEKFNESVMEKILQGVNGDDLDAYIEMWRRRIAELQLETIKDQGGLSDLFTGKNQKSITDSIKAVSNVVKLLKFMRTGKGLPTGLDPKQISELATNYKVLTEIMSEASKSAEEFWGNFGNSGLGGAIGGVGKFVSHLKLANEYSQKAATATGKAKAEYEKLAKQEQSLSAQGLVSGMTASLGVATDVVNKLKELAEYTNDKELAKSLETTGRVMQNLSAAGQGFASGGWIGAVVGGASDLITQMFDVWTENEKEIYRNKQAVIAYNQELYRLNTSIDKDKFSSIFGDDSLGLGKKSISVYTKQLTKFKSLTANINKLTEERRKYEGSFHKESGIGVFNGEFGSILKETIFDEDGNFSIDKAKAALQSFSEQLDEDQKQWLQSAIDSNEAWMKAKETMDDLLDDWYGNWGSDMTDAIFDAIINGTDAWAEFEKIGSESILKLGKSMMNSMFFQSYFKQFEERMEKAWGADDTAEELLKISSEVFGGLPLVLDQATEWGKNWMEAAKQYGFSMDTLAEASSSSLSTGIKGISEQTADLLASYVNAGRADLSVIRSAIESIDFGSLNAVASSQLAQLNMIAANTEAIMRSNDAILDRVDNIETRFARVVDVDRVRIS